ncbi:MAG: lycopene cyclase domain-containing protein [Ignavibacteria bacterium]
MEYTCLVIVGTLLVIILDVILKTHLFKQKIFWIYLGIIVVLMFVVNGYLTWRPIVIYNESKMLGIRLFTIPVEDFFFGFSLIGLNLIIWEFFNKKIKNINNK